MIYGPPGGRARKISNAKSRRYGAAATGFTQTFGSGSGFAVDFGGEKNLGDFTNPTFVGFGQPPK